MVFNSDKMHKRSLEARLSVPNVMACPYWTKCWILGNVPSMYKFALGQKHQVTFRPCRSTKKMSFAAVKVLWTSKTGVSTDKYGITVCSEFRAWALKSVMSLPNAR